MADSAGSWRDLIPAEEWALYAKAGFGRQGEWGRRPALLVIDVTYDFVGDVPEPAAKSVERWPLSCGEAGWEAIRHIAPLIDVTRSNGVPVIYTTANQGEALGDAGRWSGKVGAFETAGRVGTPGAAIVAEIAPKPGEIVLNKKKASAFFGTPLTSYLIELGVDTVIATGCTTSGCVRASVVDAFSYNYAVIVPEECSFDRVRLSHAVNLFDMQGKYADVVPVADVLSYVSGLTVRV